MPCLSSHWRSPPAHPSLSCGEIHLWRIDLRRVEPEAALLAGDERARASRLLDVRKGRQFAAARTCLRRLLGVYLERDPASFSFTYGAQGKPALAEGELAFNLSHSGDFALLALSRSGAVGIDLEQVDGRLDEMALARRYLAEAERCWLAGLPSDRRRRSFYRLWTRREALAKGLAGGVGMVLPDLVAAGCLRRFPLAAWQVRNLYVLPGFLAALAWQGAVTAVRRFDPFAVPAAGWFSLDRGPGR